MGGTLLVLRLCLGMLPGLSGRAGWQGAGLLTCLWLAFAPGQAEGLYWFTGAYTYIMTAWLLLLWLVVFGRYVAAWRAGKPGWWLVATAVMTLALAGTTEPVAFPFLLALLAGAAWHWWHSRSTTLLFLAGLALLGSAVSFAAPGNFVRMGSMGESFGVLKTLLYSLATAGYLLLTWVGNPVLLVLSALLLPALHRMAHRREQLLVRFLARIPAGWLAGFLSLLLAAANCPAYYASGTGLPLRARTTLYLLFVLGWFGVLLTWCCRQAHQKQPAAALETLATPRLRPLWLGLLGLFFLADYNVQTRSYLLGQGSNNVVRAYRQWLNGEAARFDAEVRVRYQVLATGGPRVTIQPLRNQPTLLYCFDVAGLTNPTTVQQYATYFGVPQVVVSQVPR